LEIEIWAVGVQTREREKENNLLVLCVDGSSTSSSARIFFYSESENGTAASLICSRMFLERRIGLPARSWRHQGKKNSYRGRIQNSFFVYLVGELFPLVSKISSVWWCCHGNGIWAVELIVGSVLACLTDVQTAVGYAGGKTVDQHTAKSAVAGQATQKLYNCNMTLPESLTNNCLMSSGRSTILPK